MKRITFLALLSGLLTLLPFNLPAQDQEVTVHAPDPGGFTLSIMPSTVTTVPNAPFTATVRTELIRRLEDGSTITKKNHCLLARDSSGRIYWERRPMTPDDDTHQSPLRHIVFLNPVTHERHICDPQGKFCQVSTYYQPAPQPLSAYMGGNGHTTHVPLGVSTISGVQAVGSRDLTIVPVKVASTNRPITLSIEYWYSQQLGMNVSVKRFDPRSGTQIFLIDQLVLGEPNPTLFEVPKGAKILEESAQPSN